MDDRRPAPAVTSPGAPAPLQQREPAGALTMEPVERSRVARVVDRVGAFWTLGVLAVIVVAFGLVAPDFYSQANWIATSTYATEIICLALGQTFVIITAGIDLSDGAVLGFSAMAGALVMETLLAHHLGALPDMAVGFAVAVLAGTVTGVVNGLVITRLKLSPFIATLGMLGMATAATELLNGGQDIINLPGRISVVGNGVIAGWFPVPVLITAFFCVLCWLLLSRTRFGRRTYAIGSNPEAARRAGIDINRHLIKVYALSAALASVAGLLVMSQLTDASVVAGTNDELDAIAAVVIGGASLFGGRGSIQGSIIGSLVISVMVTGLVLANVVPFWQIFAVGAIVIFAVWFDQLRLRLREL